MPVVKVFADGAIKGVSSDRNFKEACPLRFGDAISKLDRGYVMPETMLSLLAIPSEKSSRQLSVKRVAVVLFKPTAQAPTQLLVGRRQVGDDILRAAKSRKGDFTACAAGFDCFEEYELAMSTEYHGTLIP